MNTTPGMPSVLKDPAFPELKESLIGSTGLVYYADKDSELAVHVARRLARTGRRDCHAYLHLLREKDAGDTELDTLIEDLTIGETYFFRHQEMFDALRDRVLPDVIQRNRDSRHLRIWSAGCATGAEPYSVSILLRREFAARIDGWDVSVVGTDINRGFLAQAREGRYAEWAFRATSPAMKSECFEPADRSWIIKPKYREGVSFQYHNLVQHPVPSLLHHLFAFDVILCRNVTIYFHLDMIRRLLTRFHHCLVDGGWLLVGHAEPNQELFAAYRTVYESGAVLYQKGERTAAAWSDDRWPTMSDTAAVETPTERPIVAPWLARPLTDGWLVCPPLPPSSSQAGPATLAAAPAIAGLGGAAPPSELEAIRACANRGDLAETARLCEQQLTTDRLNPVIHFYLALVLDQSGQHEEAERSLRRAIYLDRSFTLAHYYLGLLLQKKGNISAAIRSFRNVLELLSRTAADHVFTDGDGIAATELRKLTDMHLTILEAA